MSNNFKMARRVTDANRVMFDAIAHTYDNDPAQKYGSFANNTGSRYREFINKNIVLINRGLVVNVGCGTGDKMDIEKECGLNSIGLDISSECLKVAESKNVGTLIQGDFYKMPFPDESASFLSGFLLLHHVYDHELFFRECYRVLMPGGVIYCDYDPNYYSVTFALNNPILSKLLNLRRILSYKIMKISDEEKDQCDAELVRLADYWSETIPGLKEEQLIDALSKAGFDFKSVIAHSDGRSLSRPKKGRVVQKIYEWILLLLGQRGYKKRAKNLALVAQKEGEFQTVRV